MLTLTIDKAAEFKIDALVRVNVAPSGPLVKLSATCERFTATHTGAAAMSYTLPADKQVRLQIEYQDKNGNPAAVDGAVDWESSDESIASVDPLTVTHHGNVPEGGVVMLVPGTKLGNCQITARADADLGEGTRELVTLMDVTVVGGEAVAGTITPVGEATPIP